MIAPNPKYKSAHCNRTVRPLAAQKAKTTQCTDNGLEWMAGVKRAFTITKKKMGLIISSVDASASAKAKCIKMMNYCTRSIKIGRRKSHSCGTVVLRRKIGTTLSLQTSLRIPSKYFKSDKKCFYL